MNNMFIHRSGANTVFLCPSLRALLLLLALSLVAAHLPLAAAMKKSLADAMQAEEPLKVADCEGDTQ